MKLYFSPGACSLAPHLALNEAGLPHETLAVDLRKKTYVGGDYRQINPKGYVPALQLDSGQVLTENAVILQYIADQKPEAQLLPKSGSFERYRCLEWETFIATEVHKGFAPFWNDKTPDSYKEILRETLGKRLEYVARHLSENEYLMGKQYTVADSYLFTVLNWSPMIKFDLSPWSSIGKFMDRVRSRPATQTTLKQEGLIK